MDAFISECQNSAVTSDCEEDPENASPSITGAFGMFSTISAAVQNTVRQEYALTEFVL